MTKTETINWKTFKDTLLQHPGLYLQFQYAEDKWINASYHITEIKYAPITSVDCGGVKNTWTEIIIQLLEPENQRQLKAMKVEKALSIIGIIERVLQPDADAIVKIEFGNSTFDTRQMLPGKITADEENLMVYLRPDAVQCKAVNSDETCGTSGGCCTPAKTELKKNSMGMESNGAISLKCC